MSIAVVPGIASSLANLKDLIEASLNLTITVMERTYFTIEKLLERWGLSRREKTSLHDCLENVDQTLDELHKTDEDLKIYPRKNSLSQHTNDLKILPSAAMTNQGFNEDEFSTMVRIRTYVRN